MVSFLISDSENHVICELQGRTLFIIILQYLTLDVSFEWSKQTPAAEAPAVEKKEESTPTEETTSKEEKKPSESESAEKK